MLRTLVFTARCTISAELRLHVVRPSVTLVDQDHTGGKLDWIEQSLMHHPTQYRSLIARTVSPTNTFPLHSPKAIHLLPGEHGEFWGD